MRHSYRRFVAEDVNPFLTFLRAQAANPCDVDVFETHEPLICDACCARSAAVSLERALERGLFQNAMLAAQAYTLRWTEGRCRCDFPGPGEDGVILCSTCEARALVEQPPLEEHLQRSSPRA